MYLTGFGQVGRILRCASDMLMSPPPGMAAEFIPQNQRNPFLSMWGSWTLCTVIGILDRCGEYDDNTILVAQTLIAQHIGIDLEQVFAY